jgi:hypothetical protein
MVESITLPVLIAKGKIVFVCGQISEMVGDIGAVSVTRRVMLFNFVGIF